MRCTGNRTKNMNTVAILSGNWSANGNFSGYNAGGQRIHIPQRQMENLGFTRDTKIPEGKFPLYALVVEREFNELDENGNPSDKTFKRLQAGSTFLTEEAMISAKNADKILEIKATKALVTEATSAGLSEDAVKAITSVVI